MQAALAVHDMAYQYLLSQGIVYKSAKGGVILDGKSE